MNKTLKKAVSTISPFAQAYYGVYVTDCHCLAYPRQWTSDLVKSRHSLENWEKKESVAGMGMGKQRGRFLGTGRGRKRRKRRT